MLDLSKLSLAHLNLFSQLESIGYPKEQAFANAMLWQARADSGIARWNRENPAKPMSIEDWLLRYPLTITSTIPQGQPNRTLQQFAGPQAQTADRSSLADAFALERKGAAPEQILAETGWFRGIDRDWRFEIDDSQARFRGYDHVKDEPEVTSTNPALYETWMDEAADVARGVLLAQALDHPKLFAAYPMLEFVRLKVMPRRIDGACLVEDFMMGGFTIEIGDPYSYPVGDAFKAVMHEIQHVIQVVEGFAVGGNADDLGLPTGHEIGMAINAEYRRRADEIEASAAYQELVEQALEQLPPEAWIHPRSGARDERWARNKAAGLVYESSGLDALESERLARIDRALTHVGAFGQGLDSRYAGYRHLAGEAEARNAAARSGMTENERIEVAPWATLDIDPRDALIRSSESRRAAQQEEPLRAGGADWALIEELAAFQRLRVEQQFDEYERREALFDRLVALYQSAPWFKGVFLPLAHGWVGVTGSAKESGRWQVSFLDSEMRPMSDTGAKGLEDALREAFGEARFDLVAQGLASAPVDLSLSKSRVRAADGGLLKVYHGTTEVKVIPGDSVPGDPAAIAELKAMAVRFGIDDYQSVRGILERLGRTGQRGRLGDTDEDAARAEVLQGLAKWHVEPSRNAISFDAFHMPTGDMELGAHFGNRDQALMFGEPFEFYLDLRNPIRLEDLGNWHYSKVIAALRAANVDVSAEDVARVERARDHNEALRALMLSKGYDGVVYRNEAEGRGDSYIALKPEAIFPADQVIQRELVATDGPVLRAFNSGEFSPDSPQILNQSASAAAPAFSRWFDGSPVMMPDGRPQVMYHGSKTPDGLTVFVPGGRGAAVQSGDLLGVASYFTSDRYEASIYAGEEGAVLPVYLNGRLLNLEAPILPADEAERLSAFAERVLLPADRARFSSLRKARFFTEDEVEEAKSFFAAERERWNALDGVMERSKPEVDKQGDLFLVRYTDFESPVLIRTSDDAQALFRSVGWGNLPALGYDGVMLTNSEGRRWVAMHRPDGNVKSAIGNNGQFNRYSPRILDQSAYHGTVAEFDRFDPAAGGGVGRSYGYGVYLTSDRGIADRYRQAMARKRGWVGRVAAVIAARFEQDYPEAVRVEGYSEGMLAEASGALVRLVEAYADHAFLVWADELAPAGQVYTAEIPSNDELLSWDMPIAEQPAAIREVLYAHSLHTVPLQPGFDRRGVFSRDGEPTGSDIYLYLEQAYDSPQKASEVLGTLGIKGLTYRHMSVGSRDYVVFAPENARIVRDGVDSSVFRDWVGDSVLTEGGEAGGAPMVFYHGTRSGVDFEVIEQTSELGGIYFDADPGRADGPGIAGQIMPVYLRAERPYVVEAEPGSEEWNRFVSRGLDCAVLAEQGYDAAVLKAAGSGDVDQVIVFSAGQIKSALGNRGTYDRGDPSILNQSAPVADVGRVQQPVRDENLKRWFGASKTVDEAGAPRVFYHITPHDFEVFHPGGRAALDGHPEGLSGKAMWFSPNREYQPAAHNVMTRSGFQPGTNVMPVHLKIERPLLLDSEVMLAWARDVFAGGSSMFPQLVLSQQVESIKEAGYDGIICQGVGGAAERNGDEYIVFDADQVKSAIGNSGTFDPGSPSILNQGAIDPDVTADLPALRDGNLVPVSGRPVAYHYAKNLEKAPDMGSLYGQDIEPAGDYMVVSGSEMDGGGTWEVGTITFRNPLVIEAEEGTVAWKKWLSARMGGKTGKDLSRAVQSLGHDGIITYDKYGLSEAISLGAPRIPSMEQQDDLVLVMSPEFAAWFKGSVVADGDRPKKVYHGSRPSPDSAPIEVFDRLYMVNQGRRKPGQDNVGIWFTETLGPDGVEKYSGGDRVYNGAVYPVYLSIKKPWAVSFYGMRRVANRLLGRDRAAKLDGEAIDALRVWMKENDIDGIQLLHDPRDGDEFVLQQVWIALEPEQVRTAITAEVRYVPAAQVVRRSAQLDQSDRVAPALGLSHEAGPAGVEFDFSLPADGNVIRDYKVAGASISLSLQANGEVSLSSLRVPVARRGRGLARQAMEALLLQADEQGVTINLGASALDRRTRTDKLVAFYQSLGFELTGRKINALGEPELLRRPGGQAGREQNLRRWFGGSKVVDESGKPLVVYHGTRREFAEFDLRNPRGAPGNPRGAYFSADRRVAEQYAENDDGEMDGKSKVIAAYLRIEDDSDGKIIDSAYRGREYVVFDPTNIKSATGNNGDFDPANPSILEQSPVPEGLNRPTSEAASDQSLRGWFGGSKVVDERGKPLVVYHGTCADFDEFVLPGKKTGRMTGGRAIFFAEAPETANGFARYEGARIIPAFLRVERPFDFRDEAHVAKFEVYLRKNFDAIAPGALYGPDTALSFIKSGDFGLLEQPPVISWMKRNGFDGIRLIERAGEKTYAVFNPEQIKPAIGNLGDFDPSSPNILAQSAVPDDLGDRWPMTGLPVRERDQNAAFQAWFGVSRATHNLQPGGTPLVVYHGTGADFDEFSDDFIGSANDEGFAGRGFYFMDDPEWASGYAELAGETGGQANVIPVHLHMENPLIIREYSELPMRSAVQHSREQSTAIVAALRESGHDGVIVLGRPGKPSEFMVLDAEQIKSAIGNSGSWDRLSRKILDQAPASEVVDMVAVLSEQKRAVRAWMGNSQITENGVAGGEPRRVYHGSPVPGISEFDGGRTAYGIFFTPDKATAGYYASGDEAQIYEAYLKIERLADFDDTEVFERVMREAIDYTDTRDTDDVQAFAARLYREGFSKNEVVTRFFTEQDGFSDVDGVDYTIEDLLSDNRIDASEIDDLVEEIASEVVTAAYAEAAPTKSEELDGAREAYGSQQFYMEYQDDFMRAARALGYDGVVFSDPSSTGASVSYVVFEPGQIMLAPDAEDPVLEQPAWHGTPYQFDSFELQKVGSSEGAADYGWGVYFASRREVALWYSGALGVSGSTVPQLFTIRGVLTVRGEPEQKAADLVYGMGLPKAKKLAREWFKESRGVQPVGGSRDEAYYAAVLDVLEGLSSARDVRRAPGNLLSVDIPDADQLLDWDAPLHAQPAAVIRAVETLSSRLGLPAAASAGVWYKALAREVGSDKQASFCLRAEGVPGISYLDGVSRGTTGGTRNFVVFDDRLLSILGRERVSVLNQFAGEKAAGADLLALKLARRLVRQGRSPAEVLVETGWSSGVDGQWRFELDDSQAALRPEVVALLRDCADPMDVVGVAASVSGGGSWTISLAGRDGVARVFDRVPAQIVPMILPAEVMDGLKSGAGRPVDLAVGGRFLEALALDCSFRFAGVDALPLPAVLDYPALFDAYPMLRGSCLSFVEGVRSMTSAGGDVLVGRDLHVSRLLPVTLHEVQHIIQTIEGFAMGGAPEMAFASPALNPMATRGGFRAAKAILQEKIDDMGRPASLEDYARDAWGIASGQVITDDVQASYGEYVDGVARAAAAGTFSRPAQEAAAREWYRRLAGEMEARLVERRWRLSAEERRAVLPADGLDVDPKDAIVLRYSASAACVADSVAAASRLGALIDDYLRVDTGLSAWFKQSVVDSASWSKGECEKISVDLVGWLREQGCVAEVIFAQGLKAGLDAGAAADWELFRDRGGRAEHFWHAAVLCDGVVADLSGAQFGSRYAGVRLLTTGDFLAEWESVRVTREGRAVDLRRLAADRVVVAMRAPEAMLCPGGGGLARVHGLISRGALPGAALRETVAALQADGRAAEADDLRMLSSSGLESFGWVRRRSSPGVIVSLTALVSDCEGALDHLAHELAEWKPGRFGLSVTRGGMTVADLVRGLLSRLQAVEGVNRDSALGLVIEAFDDAGILAIDVQDAGGRVRVDLDFAGDAFKQALAEEEAPRAQIALGQNLAFDIRLLAMADSSSFAHETGHAFLEILRDQARMTEAENSQIRTDWQAVSRWLQLEALGDHQSIPGEAHERFARGFELYLRKGVAPSAEMEGVFKLLADLLRQVYEAIRSLFVRLPSDIEEVFARMLSEGDPAYPGEAHDADYENRNTIEM